MKSYVKTLWEDKNNEFYPVSEACFLLAENVYKLMHDEYQVIVKNTPALNNKLKGMFTDITVEAKENEPSEVGINPQGKVKENEGEGPGTGIGGGGRNDSPIRLKRRNRNNSRSNSPSRPLSKNMKSKPKPKKAKKASPARDQKKNKISRKAKM